MKKVLSLAALAALFAFPVVAQQNCAPRDLVVERLASEYGETRQVMGLTGNGTLFEIFASTESGTWTVTMTVASGLACFMASGESFEALAEALPIGEEG